MAKKKENLFKWDAESYDKYAIKEALRNGSVTDAEIRAEYSRLRNVANKRLQRFEGTRFVDYDSYARNIGKYRPLKDIDRAVKLEAERIGVLGNEKLEREIYLKHISSKMHDLSKFLSAKTSSITGIREVESKVIQTFRDKGITFITSKNLKQFGDYMETLRALHNGRQFDSERALDLFGTATKKGLPMSEILSGEDATELLKSYNFWLGHEERLAATPRFRNPELRTSENYLKRMGLK